MRRMLAALGTLVVLVAASACSSGGGDAHPIGKVPGPNPDVIPAVITPAYVDAVFRVLNHINGNAVRSLLGAGRVTATVTTDLRAIYSGSLYGQELKIANESLRGDLSNVRRPPGDISTTVLDLLSSSPTCIFVKTRSTFQAVLLKPSPPAASEYFRLSAKQSTDDPDDLNPTPWSLSFNASYQTPTPPFLTSAPVHSAHYPRHFGGHRLSLRIRDANECVRRSEWRWFLLPGSVRFHH